MAQTYKFGNGTWATKKGSTLAYSDTNNAFKPLPFSFERNSIATRVNKEGLIEVVGNDIPRIDYTDSTEGALLLENSSTNLIPYSEDFSQSNWNKFGSSVTSGFISPSGGLNAFKLVEDTSTGSHFIFLYSQQQNNSYSIFAKKGEKKWIFISSHTTSSPTARGQFFDLENGVVGSSGAANGKIEDYGNGWYRCSTEANAASSLFTVMLAEGDGVYSYQGNGTDGVYIWGAQNTDTDLSSYIPTNGSTVQRAAETCNDSGNSEVFNDSQGVLFANIAANADDGSLRTITLGDNSSSNAVSFRYDNPNQITLYLNSGGASQCSFAASVPTLLFNKCLIKYKANDFSAWVNGFEIGVDSSGITFPSGTLDRINFDIGYTSSNPFFGKTKEIAYYNTILTDEELEYLTSYRSLNEMVTELNLNAL